MHGVNVRINLLCICVIVVFLTNCVSAVIDIRASLKSGKVGEEKGNLIRYEDEQIIRESNFRISLLSLKIAHPWLILHAEAKKDQTSKVKAVYERIDLYAKYEGEKDYNPFVELLGWHPGGWFAMFGDKLYVKETIRKPAGEMDVVNNFL